MLDKEILKELTKDMIENQTEELKQKYEDTMLNLINSQIYNITENYFNAKTLVGIIETLEKITNTEKGDKTNE